MNASTDKHSGTMTKEVPMKMKCFEILGIIYVIQVSLVKLTYVSSVEGRPPMQESAAVPTSSAFS